MQTTPTKLVSLLSAFTCTLAAVNAAPPPAPSNVRVINLPAEILFTWDVSPGADWYQVHRGGPYQLWMPLPPITEPRFRDADFTDLPSYYEIAACNADGCTATGQFLVYSATNDLRLIGATPRPLSDTSFAVAWTIGGANGFGMGDGMLEVGTNLDVMTLVGTSEAQSWRHEFAAANLLPNTAYFYRLTSWGSNGGGFTYTGQFNTRPFTLPPPALVSLTDPNPTLATDEDMPVDFTLTADNPGGGQLEFFVTDVPFGTMSGTPPHLTYVSNPEHSGTDYFDCRFTDGVTTNYARVFVAVSFVQDSPIALDQSLTFKENLPRKFFLSAWSYDAVALHYVILSGPTNGVLHTNEPWLINGEYQYDPSTNFNGIDHITFAAYDSYATGNVATWRFRVMPTNSPPIAVPQSVGVSAGDTANIILTASDPDGDSLSFDTVTPPAHGIVNWGLNGNASYSPEVGYTGPDSFSYRVVDPSGLDGTATVTINIYQPNHAPVVNSSSQITEYGVPVNITLSGSDPDGDALTFIVLGQPVGGTLSGTPPNLLFTPAHGFSGLTGFLFKANDGALDSPASTNSITVTEWSVPPNAPTRLIAAAISRSRVKLSWKDNSRREGGFKIERSTDNRKWSQVGSVGANVTTFINTGLSSRKLYRYRVKACLGPLNSAWSNVATITTRQHILRGGRTGYGP